MRNQLDLERAKSSKQEHVPKAHRIPSGGAEDFSDDVTVLRKNVAAPKKDVTALEDEIAFLRYYKIQQEALYKDSLKDSLENNVQPARLMRHVSGDSAIRIHRDRFRPDDDIEMINQPFAHESKRMPRSGLQEVDTEAPRPPLSRQSSGARGSAPSPLGLPPTGLNSRSFAMDAVRLSVSSRSLGAGF